MYYFVDQQGVIDNYIQCSNKPRKTILCSHMFYLKPAQNVMVTIQYRIGLLPKWKEIQSAVDKKILSFSTKPIDS